MGIIVTIIGKLITTLVRVQASKCKISGDPLPDRRSVVACEPHWKEALCCLAKRNLFITLI